MTEKEEEKIKELFWELIEKHQEENTKIIELLVGQLDKAMVLLKDQQLIIQDIARWKGL